MPIDEARINMKVSDNGFLRVRFEDGVRISVPLLRERLEEPSEESSKEPD